MRGLTNYYFYSIMAPESFFHTALLNSRLNFSQSTQIITISASFVLLSKASIDLDLEMYEHKLTFKDTVVHYLKTAPGYCATIAFRALAFSITLAFFRFWSLIPICFLMFEFIAAYRIAFGTFGSFDGVVDSPFLPMMITNLGVSNVGMIGACGYMRSKSKEEGKFVYEYLGKTNTFIRLSSIASFIHHATVLTVILALVIHDPTFFEHQHLSFKITIGFFMRMCIISIVVQSSSAT